MSGWVMKVKDIGFQQILMRDGSVYSVQWIDLPERLREEVAPPLLLQRYFRLIRDFTCSIIRPTVTETGVEFRLLSSRLALLSFGPPQYRKLAGAGCLTERSCLSPSAEGEAADLFINGGVLVQSGHCDRGKFSVMVTNGPAGGLRITVELSDFCPLLLKSTTPSWPLKTLYRLTQAYIHKVVTVKYLITLYRELTGEKVRGRIEKVQILEGEEI